MPNKLKILFLLSFSYLSSFADSTSTQWEIGTMGGIGHIWAHVSKVNYLNASHIYNQEVSITKVPSGNKGWHHSFNFTKYGVLLGYSNFGNEEVGNSYSIVPFYDFNLWRASRSWLSFRFGIGLGYLSNKFDKDENHKNIIIGSNINASIDATLQYNYAVSKKVLLCTAASIGHFSNAKYSAPNTGINYPKFLIGVKYRNFEKQDFEKAQQDKIKRKWNFHIAAGAGMKENATADENKYFSANVSALSSYQFSSKSSWGVNVDFIHDSGKMRLAKAKEGIHYSNAMAYTAIGLAASYELSVNNTSFLFQLGKYLTNSNIMNEPFYNRLGLNQKISKALSAHVAIRNHKVNAQTVELGLAYKIK